MAGGDLCQARRGTATLLWLEGPVAQQQPAPAPPSHRLPDRPPGISRLMPVGDDKKRRRQMFHVLILSIIALTSSAPDVRAVARPVHAAGRVAPAGSSRLY